MTISSTTNRVSYAGDGDTTAFSFPHRFLADADLLVILVTDSTGVETTQTLTTDYTVSGAGNASGGTVTMNSAPASGETLVIINDPALKQQSDYVDAAALDAETLEDNVDRLTLIAQRTRVLQERSARFSDGYTGGVSPVMPEPTALRLLRWNSDGDALELVQVGDLGELSTGRTGTDVPTNSDISVASLSDLQAIDPSTVPADFVIYVRGRTTVGDGGEGHFRWDSSNLSTEVGNDEVTTNEGDGGIYIAPASDKTGASGAWVRQFSGHVNVLWWGAVADNDGTSGNGTDNFTAFDIPINKTIFTDSSGIEIASTVIIPLPVNGKAYRIGQTINLKKVVRVVGESGWGHGLTDATTLRFDDDTQGVVLNDSDTLDNAQVTSTTRAAGSIIENLAIKGGGSAAEINGIRLRQRGILRNVRVEGFPQDGVNIVATGGSGGSTEGNANLFRIENLSTVNNGRDGLFIDGSDVNAGSTIGVNATDNGRWGINDESFLGNTHVAPHTARNGTKRSITDITKANPAVVTTSSAHGLETGDHTYIENVSGMTEINGSVSSVTKVSDTKFELDDIDSSGFTAYSSGGDAWYGSAYRAENANAHTVFIGAYVEGGQPFVWIDNRCIYIAGEGPTKRSGPGLYIDGEAGLSKIETKPSWGDVLLGRSEEQILRVNPSDGRNRLDCNVDTSKYVWGVGSSDTVAFLHDGNTQTFGRGTAPGKGSVTLPSSGVILDPRSIGRVLQLDRDKPDGGGNSVQTGEHAQGDVVINNAGNAGEPVGWQCTSAGTPGTFTEFGQVGHRTNAGDPNSSVTPNFVGEELLDTTNSKWYKSTGTANTDWAALN